MAHIAANPIRRITPCQGKQRLRAGITSASRKGRAAGESVLWRHAVEVIIVAAQREQGASEKPEFPAVRGAQLRDIQADEELSMLLEREVSSESRLVRIPSDRLARVLELLRERGFAVED